MGLFGGGTREEKEARKQEAMLSKYHLTELSNPDDIESVKTIIEELAGTGMMELGLTLGGGSEKDLLKTQMYYQRALLEQNFIMIRQLNRIEKALQNE
jgi:hypothetical protein